MIGQEDIPILISPCTGQSSRVLSLSSFFFLSSAPGWFSLTSSLSPSVSRLSVSFSLPFFLSCSTSVHIYVVHVCTHAAKKRTESGNTNKDTHYKTSRDFHSNSLKSAALSEPANAEKAIDRKRTLSLHASFFSYPGAVCVFQRRPKKVQTGEREVCLFSSFLYSVHTRLSGQQRTRDAHVSLLKQFAKYTSSTFLLSTFFFFFCSFKCYFPFPSRCFLFLTSNKHQTDS